MTVVVAYKWAANPQDASVGTDGVVDWSRAKPAVSEYDPVAIQLAREVADAGALSVVGISVGTSSVATSFAKKAAMSRGLDRGLVVADDRTASWNLTQVAQALALLVARVDDVDLVLAGDGSIDENAKMVPALLAGFLGWPCFQDVKGVTRSGSGWRITQIVPGGTRELKVEGAVVVSVASDAVQPKVAGMKDILAAAKKVVDEVPLGDLRTSQLVVEIVGRSKPVGAARRHRIFAADDVAGLVAALHTHGII